eukprot:1569589-Prymnesium_polylepis.1
MTILPNRRTQPKLPEPRIRAVDARLGGRKAAGERRVSPFGSPPAAVRQASPAKHLSLQAGCQLDAAPARGLQCRPLWVNPK